MYTCSEDANDGARRSVGGGAGPRRVGGGVAVGGGVPVPAEAQVAVALHVVSARPARGAARTAEPAVRLRQRPGRPDAVRPPDGPARRAHGREAVRAAVPLALEPAHVHRPDGGPRHGAALWWRAHASGPVHVVARRVPAAAVVVVPRGAGVVVGAPHPGHVPAGEVSVGEALEQRRAGAAAEEEEHVVRVGRQVRLPPLLDHEAVAPARGGAIQRAAVGHGWVVQGEAPVRVVHVQDAVRARGQVQHQRAVDAEEHVPETRVAATGTETEGVVHRDVAAERPARRDRHVGGEGSRHRRGAGAQREQRGQVVAGARRCHCACCLRR
jgi:hypothetical protein